MMDNHSNSIDRGFFAASKLLGMALVVGLCLTGYTAKTHADPQVEAENIQALYQAWRDAVERSDIDGYVSLLHPNVRLLPPGAEPIEGADNYAAFLEPVFATATYEIDIVQLQEVDVLGNVAVAEYVYTIKLDLIDPHVEVNEPGALTANSTTARYFDVLLKDDEGQWSVWRHSWQEIPQ